MSLMSLRSGIPITNPNGGFEDTMRLAKANSASEGVRDAWALYLADHPITIPESIEDAVLRAFSSWLETHTEELIRVIAQKCAEAQT